MCGRLLGHRKECCGVVILFLVFVERKCYCIVSDAYFTQT